MVCPRCDGLMLQEVFVDFAGMDGSFEGWRCLVCGEIVDPVIASNRVLLIVRGTGTGPSRRGRACVANRTEGRERKTGQPFL